MPADPARHEAAARRVIELSTDIENHDRQLEWTSHWSQTAKSAQLRMQIASKQVEVAKLTKYLRTGALADLPAGFVATPPPGRVEPPTRFKLIP